MGEQNLASRTKQSPRFEENVICFYEGDTFDLELNLELERDGEPIEIQPEDTVTIEFKKDDITKVNPVLTLEYTNIQDGKIVVNFDSDTTSKFTRGRYTYKLKFNSEYVTTLIASNRIVVS